VKREANASPAPLHSNLYVLDVDTAYQRALRAGGTSMMEVSDQFYGDRSGAVQDPAGNRWWIATHQEDVSAEELQRRMDKFSEQRQAEQKQKAA